MAQRPLIHRHPTPPQTPEFRLILASARVSLDPGCAAEIRRLLDQKLDWEQVLSAASVQGILPLLHWHLSRIGGQQVPAPVAERLRQSFLRNLRSNLWLTGELLRLLPWFAERQIPVVPFKGPVLTASLYGNLGLREFGDLDLLVHPPDVLRAKALLLEAGYQPELELTPRQERALLRNDCEYNFRNPETKTRVEVHWRMIPRHFSLPLDPDPWWQRLQMVSLNGTAVPMFAFEDLLLFLCVHGGKHCWQRLSAITDVAELLRQHSNLEWERVFVQAGQARAQRMLLLGLHLAHHLLDAPLPEKIQAAIRSETMVCDLGSDVHHWLACSSKPRAVWSAVSFVQREREDRWDRVRFFLRVVLIPTPVEWSLLRLPSLLYPLYSAFRVGRLVLKYAVAAARRWLAGKPSPQP